VVIDGSDLKYDFCKGRDGRNEELSVTSLVGLDLDSPGTVHQAYVGLLLLLWRCVVVGRVGKRGSDDGGI
jgi:hypothetical protein